MAIKEHPFVVSTTLQGDGVTIKYDVTKPNRSDAVGKAYRMNADGKAELVAAGNEIDGKVLHVDDANNITAAYMFGGLRLPIGDSETVAKGDKLVGALGPSSAKGYVKTAPAATALAALVTADIDTDAEKLTAYNAARTQISNLAAGKGAVINFDTTDALVSFPG